MDVTNKISGYGSNPYQTQGVGAAGGATAGAGAGAISNDQTVSETSAPKGDGTTISAEAQGAAGAAGAQGGKGGNSQQVEQELSAGIKAAQVGGDKSQLKQTYDQAKQNGSLEGVKPEIRKQAEELLGVNGAQGGGGAPGAQGGGDASGAQAPAQAGGGAPVSGAGGAAEAGDKQNYPSQLGDQLDKLLGKDNKVGENQDTKKTEDKDKEKNAGEAGAADAAAGAAGAANAGAASGAENAAQPDTAAVGGVDKAADAGAGADAGTKPSTFEA